MRLAESHEPFQSTEIGEFPESWDVLPLGALFDVQQGKALSPSARMGASPPFQDVVVVHELLHLFVPNHGKLFKSLMTAYVPGWESRSRGRAARLCGTPSGS